MPVIVEGRFRAVSKLQSLNAVASTPVTENVIPSCDTDDGTVIGPSVVVAIAAPVFAPTERVVVDFV